MKIYLVESGDTDATTIHGAYSNRDEAMKHLKDIANFEYETHFQNDEFDDWYLFETENGYRISRSEKAGFALQWYDIEELEVRDKYE